MDFLTSCTEKQGHESLGQNKQQEVKLGFQLLQENKESHQSCTDKQKLLSWYNKDNRMNAMMRSMILYPITNAAFINFSQNKPLPGNFYFAKSWK